MPRLTALTLPLLLTLTLGGASGAAVPLPPLSSLTLPVSLPLASLRSAALAHIPEVLGRVDQEQTLAGGLLKVHLSGEVRRDGDLTLIPEGDGLRLELPVRARLHAAPLGASGLGTALTRDFSGAALITAHLTPLITPDWNAGVKVQADYRWTDPLRFELLRGVSVNIQSLVDPQIRSRLDSVSAALDRTVRDGLHLRARADTLWTRLGQPWTLPGVPDGYATLRPQEVAASPVTFGPDGAHLTLAGTFRASAGVGQPPVAAPTLPLPPLRTGLPEAQGVHLHLPVTLAYPQLSALATRAAARQDYPLPLPFGPRLTVQDVTLSAPGGGRLNAAVRLTLRALGLSVAATVDVSGTPTLDGEQISLRGVTVRTRPDGVSGRVLGWLADQRVQAMLARQASIDLGPELARVRAAIQAQLPSSPTPGVTLSGRVRRLALLSLEVGPQGVVALTDAQGDLEARVELREELPSQAAP